MSQERLSMKKLKEILRLHFECNLGNRKIARALKLSATTVGQYIKGARQANLNWSNMVTLTDQAIQALLEPHCQHLKPRKESIPIDYTIIHRELKKKGVTRELLHEEYLRSCPEGKGVSYATFCSQYRDFKKTLKPSMRQMHIAGEKTFVDYVGPTVPIYNSVSGEIQQAVIFVGVLGASNFTYAEATLSRSLPDWIGSHVRMFEYFGGVSELIIPDNEKSAVTKACYYDPEINPNYAALAAHYNTAVLPARPYHPKDKSKAEVGVQVVERWILARLRHQQFFSLAELNKAIWHWLEVLNDKPFKKLPGSRRSTFESLEKSTLKPLPPHRYEYKVIKKAQVGLDYHVGIDHHHYSVPHAYIQKTVEYHLSEKMVAIFFQGERIALHERSYCVGKATTMLEHMPKAHFEHRQWTPQLFMAFAQQVGEAMVKVAVILINKNVNSECCYRTHLGFKNLAKRFDHDRLNQACAYALKYKLLSFKHIKSILDTQCDKVDESLPDICANDTKNNQSYHHQNLRGPHYYSTTKGDLNS